MIWKTYKYMYYWLYTWQKKMWGTNDVPEHNAAIGMSLSLICNFGSFAVIFYMITGIMIAPFNLGKLIFFIPVAMVAIFHYFIFVHRGKYKKIEKEFKGESETERRRKGFWVLIYAFGSIVLFIFLMFFGIWIRR